MLANNSKIEGSDTAVACADHSSHHLPHYNHLHPHHHRFSSPLHSHLPRNHYREQHHDPQQQQHCRQQRYRAFEQSTESVAPYDSSKKSNSSSPSIIILSSSLSSSSSSFSSYSYNPPQRQHALPPFLHNNSGPDGRTGSCPLSLPPSSLVPQTHHSLHPPPSPLLLPPNPPFSLSVPNSRQSPLAWPTIAAPPTSAPIPNAASIFASASASASPSISSSSSLPKRTPAITTDMDIDDMATQGGGRQHMGVGQHEKIELLKSDSSNAMDQCEPQRGWSPSSSSSSQHSSSPSPIMAKAGSMGPVRIMKRHSYGGHNEDQSPFRRNDEMCWKGDQGRRRSSDGYQHGHGYKYSDECQGEGGGKGGVLSTALSLRTFARSQSEHRLAYRPELAEEDEEGALESHRRKHARVTGTDPFPRARGAMATAATLGTTPRAAEADVPARKSLVPIGPNHTIQRDHKHHSWPMVARPPAAAPLSSCSPLPSPSSLAVSASSPLKSPPASDVVMAVAAPRTVSAPLPSMGTYPRSLSGTNLLKRRQSSPTPSPSVRRVASFGYMSEAQRTLYERHPPSPSPPISPPGPPAGVSSLEVTPKRSSLSLSPESLRSPKVENVLGSNYVHSNAQTPMQHRLPPISKDGYLQGYERDEPEQEEDNNSWYDYQQQQQQQKYLHRDQQQRYRPTKLLPRIKAPPSDDLCHPRGQLIEPPSSGSSNHSFSAESSTSPTYPPSTYLPPPHPSTRSSSLAHPNQHRHEQAPQQQHPMFRDSYPPSHRQPVETSHISYEYRPDGKQQRPSHTAHSWDRHGHRSLSSTLDRRSALTVPPHLQNYNLQQQRYPGQRLPSADYRSNSHQIHNSSVHRSLLQPSPSFSVASSSSLHVIKNKSEGTIMVFNPQTESMTFKCELCPFESFGRIHDLKRHQTSKHKEMTWPCDFCHRPFVRRDALLRHYTVKAARDDGLHPASHEVEKLLEARARAKMLY